MSAPTAPERGDVSRAKTTCRQTIRTEVPAAGNSLYLAVLVGRVSVRFLHDFPKAHCRSISGSLVIGGSPVASGSIVQNKARRVVVVDCTSKHGLDRSRLVAAPCIAGNERRVTEHRHLTRWLHCDELDRDGCSRVCGQIAACPKRVKTPLPKRRIFIRVPARKQAADASSAAKERSAETVLTAARGAGDPPHDRRSNRRSFTDEEKLADRVGVRSSRASAWLSSAVTMTSSRAWCSVGASSSAFGQDERAKLADG